MRKKLYIHKRARVNKHDNKLDTTKNKTLDNFLWAAHKAPLNVFALNFKRVNCCVLARILTCSAIIPRMAVASPFCLPCPQRTKPVENAWTQVGRARGQKTYQCSEIVQCCKKSCVPAPRTSLCEQSDIFSKSVKVNPDRFFSALYPLVVRKAYDHGMLRSEKKT